MLLLILMVRVTGLEPACLTTYEPKSYVSANSTTPAYEQQAIFPTFVYFTILFLKNQVPIKTFPEVTSPKSTESTNSTTSAYSFVPLFFTRGGTRGGAFRLIHDL